MDDLLLSPKEVKDTLLDLKVRENCLGHRVTPLKKYDALLYAQLAKAKLHYQELLQQAEVKRMEVVYEEAKKQERERIISMLPNIPTRFKHNQTCFDCIESIKRQALKGETNE